LEKTTIEFEALPLKIVEYEHKRTNAGHFYRWLLELKSEDELIKGQLGDTIHLLFDDPKITH